MSKTWMLGIVTLVVVLFMASLGRAEGPSAKLLAAIERHESGGKLHPRPGDDGEALGPFQIHKKYWEEACGFLGVNWDYETGALDESMSRAVCKAYLSHYGNFYRRITGKEPTDQVYARIHNGGPKGYKRSATKGYWPLVKQYM